MTNVRKPTSDSVTEPYARLVLLQSFYEAIVELQGILAKPSPASVAAAAGPTAIMVLRGATVTLPGSAATFTADIYVTGIAT